MTEDDKKAPPPADDAGIQEWIAYALEKSFQADQLNGLNRDQVRALVKGEPMPGATEKPEAEAPVPARKRASSRTRKAAAAITEAAAAVVPEPTTALTLEQRSRVEALEVASTFLPFDVQNGITLCDLAEYVLTGLHPIGSYAGGTLADPDPDDGGPGLTFVGSPTQTGATPHQTGATA